MKKETIILILLAVVNFTTIMDFMVMMPLGQELQDYFNMDPEQWGMALASYTIAGAITGFASAFFLDRLDRKKTLLVLYAGFTVGTLWCGMASSYEMLVAARSFTGAFGGIIGAVVLSIVGDITPFERRGTAMGIVSAGFSAAAALGVPTGLYFAVESDWRMPFFIIVVTAIPVFMALWKLIPPLNSHIGAKHSLLDDAKVIIGFFKDKNQRTAIGFFALLIFSHFVVIPFFAPYMEKNVGFSQSQLVYIYLFGGIATLFSAPTFGKLADRFGKKRVFVIMAVLSCIPIYILTNIGPMDIIAPLIFSTLFFITVNGRLVPAQALVISTAEPQHRGTFMSVKTSIQYLGVGLASILAGYVVKFDETTNGYVHFSELGYSAIAFSLLTLIFVRRFVAKY